MGVGRSTRARCVRAPRLPPPRCRCRSAGIACPSCGQVKLRLMRAGAHLPNTQRRSQALDQQQQHSAWRLERTAVLNTASASLFFSPGGGAGSGGGAVPRLSQVDLPAELAPSALVSGRQSRPGAHASAAVSVFDCVVKLGYIDATQRARRCRERRRSRTQAQPGLRGCIIGRGGVPPACLPPLEGMSGTVPGYRWTYYIIIMYGRARACAC